MATQNIKRPWGRKKKAGIEVWYGRGPEDLPNKKIGSLLPEVFTSYSGPDSGLALVHQLEEENKKNGNGTTGPQSPTRNKQDIAGASSWNVKSRKAYGICMSLYDQNPVNGKISGDPIADGFAVCARKNNALMIVADGVNWGEKSKLAARCAVYGCMKYVNEQLFNAEKPLKNTHDVFLLLLKSLDVAHEVILKHEGGLTTLCAALICPVRFCKQFVVCIVNVGDSLAYVFSKHHGVREITTGSHDVQSERDIRDAGGALGPVNGINPELHNLTCSLTYVDPGDIVFLTTDGISDNFDPVVTKIAVARKFSDPEVKRPSSESENEKDNISEKDSKESENKNGNEASENHENKNEVSSEKTTENEAIKGEGSSSVNQNEAKNGESSASVTQDEAKNAENSASVNQNEAKTCENNVNQNEAKDGESSASVSQNDAKNAENSASVNQNEAKNGESSASSNKNDKKCEQNSVNQNRTKTNGNSSGENENDTTSNSVNKNSDSVEKSENEDEESSRNNENETEISTLRRECGVQDGKPEMEPHERHFYAVKEMERIIHEFELFAEVPCSAQELCGAILQHVLKLTDPKRKVLENPDLYRKKKKVPTATLR